MTKIDEYVLLQWDNFGSIFAKDSNEYLKFSLLLVRERKLSGFCVDIESGGFRLKKEYYY